MQQASKDLEIYWPVGLLMVARKIEMHMNCVMEIGVLMCQNLNETLCHHKVPH
jgi:hypothetical protein